MTLPCRKKRSLLSQSIQSALLMAVVSVPAVANQETEKDMEHISVYGHHNQLILDSGTATKSKMVLMETPAAVVVVDKKLLNEQASDSLQESIRNISGLTHSGNNYGVGDNLIIRGLGANYTYDGMYGGAGLGNTFNPTRSMTNIESIEVLKGPATGLYGIGAAGGVINLVEKKPQDKPAYTVKVKGGQWDAYGLMLDATSAITDKLAYRLVANHDSSDGYRGLSEERSELYGSLRYRFNSDNSVRLSTAWIEDELQVDSVGHPVRIINWDSTPGTPGSVTGEDLANGTDADNDGIYGLQLTQEQRQQLAESLSDTDGLEPHDLGEQGLISPLSEPNDGSEKRIKLRHDLQFGQTASLTQQLQYRKYDSDYVRQTGAYNYVYWNRRGEINANPRAPLVVDGELYPFSARRQEYRRQVSEESSWQYFADLRHDWQLFGLNGEQLISANYEDRDMSVKSWSAYDADGSDSANALPYILDIRNPNWGSGSIMDYDPILRSNYDKSVSAWGISLQEVIYFTPKLTGRFGGAHSTIEQSYQHKGTDRAPGISDEADTDDSGYTYNVGLNYRFVDNIAGFVNLSKGRTAYSILGGISGENDRPDSESKSFDVGVRFTAFDDNLLGSLVWFETRRTNLRYANPDFNDNPEDPEYNIDVPQYFYDDEDNTEGVEFDLNLSLNERWSMNANATYQDAISIRADEHSAQSKGVPKKFASLWTSYDYSFSALPEPLKLSLGVTYEDEKSINSTAFGLPDSTVDSYVVWDAAAAYTSGNWNFQLNVQNLLNETYYTKALFLGGLPGESRNVEFKAVYNF